MAKIDQLLEIVKSANVTDLHLAARAAPMVRVNGQLEKTRHRLLSGENIRQLVYEILGDDEIRSFEKNGDLNFAYSVNGLGRFRMNIYRTQVGICAAVRLIPERIKSLKSLGFGGSVDRLAESRSGLVLVTGPANSGKTTTLAAMIDHINTRHARHIITLEDPIEYIHANKNSLVSQRQIGLHAKSFADALHAALREDCDVIVVGELRETETLSLALAAAETGILVLGVLHTESAAATVDRIIDVFPANQQQYAKVLLADSMRGIISQQLLSRADGSSCVLAYELMLGTPSIAALIRENKSDQIPAAVRAGHQDGMQLLDDHLKELIETEQVSIQEGSPVASNPSRPVEAANQDKMEEVVI